MPSHYLNQCWNIFNLILRNKIEWNINRNSYMFIHENAFKHVVCKMSAILSRPQYVNIRVISSASIYITWWRHQMETFSALLAICAGNSPVPGEVPTQRPVTRSFDVFFDLHPNIRLSKQSWGWWFETPSRPLWRHRNDIYQLTCNMPSPVPFVFDWMLPNATGVWNKTCINETTKNTLAVRNM